MAVFAFGVVVAPVLGPTLGGWLTDTYSWRYAFYINIPIGILALFMINRFILDPAYISKAKVPAARPLRLRRPRRLDRLPPGHPRQGSGGRLVRSHLDPLGRLLPHRLLRLLRLALLAQQGRHRRSQGPQRPQLRHRLRSHLHVRHRNLLHRHRPPALLSRAPRLHRLHRRPRRRPSRHRSHLRHAHHRLPLQQGRPPLPPHLRLHHLRPHHPLLRQHHPRSLPNHPPPPHPHHRLRPQLRLRPHQHRRLRNPRQQTDRQRLRHIQPHAQHRRLHRHRHRPDPAHPPQRRPSERDHQLRPPHRPAVPELTRRHDPGPHRRLRQRQRDAPRPDPPLPGVEQQPQPGPSASSGRPSIRAKSLPRPAGTTPRVPPCSGDQPGQRGQHPVAADRHDHVAAGDGLVDQGRHRLRSRRVRHVDGGARLAEHAGRPGRPRRVRRRRPTSG